MGRSLLLVGHHGSGASHDHVLFAEREEGIAGRHLYRAAVAGDLVAMATALAEGAEVNTCIAEEEGRTALIGAAIGVKLTSRSALSIGYHVDSLRLLTLFGLQGSLLACEFLLQNGANINHRDLRGRGSLHTAATAGHTG